MTVPSTRDPVHRGGRGIANPHRVELLVVGGGPAGLATAIAARRRGLDVLVVDRRTPPLDKPCGEGLMPDGLAQLQALGVQLAPDDGMPFRGIRYVDGPRVAEGIFTGSAGLGLRRVKLHHALLREAEILGVEFGWGRRVDDLVAHRNGRWGVRTGDVTLEPDWLAAADGLHSRLRRLAGLEAGARRPHRFGVRRHYEIRPWNDLVEVHWGAGCEAYVTPVGPSEVGIALLWSGGKAGFAGLLQRFPGLLSRLRGAAVRSKDLGAGPLWQRATQVCRGHLALVGDSSGYVDALTGEGLALALHQAQALAEAIHEGDLEAYAARHRELVRVPELVTRLTLLLSRHPSLRHRAVAALAADPATFSHLLAILNRERSISSLGFRSVFRFLLHLLARPPVK